MYAVINNTLVDADNALISAVGEGISYGYGLFETIKIVDRSIIFMEEHYNRMKKGCLELDLHFDYKLDQLLKSAEELIQLNNIIMGSVKIQYIKNNNNYDLFVTSKDNKYRKEQFKKGFHICDAFAKRNPYSKLTYIKSNNYLENIIEKTDANNNGFDEAIYYNVKGELSEGTFTNIFFARNNIVYTPSIDCGLLPGVMREKMIELTKLCSIKLEMGQFQKKDLLEADEIFLTNSLLEIMPVSKMEDKTFRLDCNEITNSLRNNMNLLYSLNLPH